MALNHRANDEAAAAQWAVREHKALRDESFKVFQVHTDDAQVLQELETNLGGLFSSTFAQWRRGRLVELDLGGPLCLFGKSRDAQIEPLHRLTFLEGLSLRGDLGITDQGLRILRPLSKLKSLILDEMQIGDDCLPNLANLTRLETLYLGKVTLLNEKIRRKGVFTDRGLRRLKKLRRLYAFSLDFNEVTGAFLESFESLARLQYFSCSESPFSDRGLNNLARVRRLTKLDLTNTGITDEGVRHLARLKNLSEIYVEGSKATAEGLKVIAALNQNDPTSDK